MPALPITDEQKQDAARLSNLWLLFKDNTPGATQEKLAAECGWKTQGAVSQYLRGQIPLNLPALLKFAKALHCEPEHISPTLAAQLPEHGGAPPQSGHLVNMRHPAQKPLPGELLAQKMGELTVINAMSVLGEALDHADDLTRKQIALILEALTLDPSRAAELGQRIEAALDQAVAPSQQPHAQHYPDPPNLAGAQKTLPGEPGWVPPYVSRNLPDPYLAMLERDRRIKNRRA